MKYFLMLFVFAVSLSSYAGFGGSRGGFSGGRSSFSSSRSFSRGSSSFGGSRATVNAPIVRPSTSSSYSRPSTSSTTHVYHTDSGISNFTTGMVLGSALSRPTTVITQPVVANPAVAAQPSYSQPSYTTAQSSGIGFWGILWNLICICFFVGIAILAVHWLIQFLAKR